MAAFPTWSLQPLGGAWEFGSMGGPAFQRPPRQRHPQPQELEEEEEEEGEQQLLQRLRVPCWVLLLLLLPAAPILGSLT